MTRDFVLVHGAWHGAWAWDHLRPVLEREGHRTLAVELPVDDVGADASAYAQAIADAVDEAGWTRPIVVGHSLAGVALPLVPGLFDVEQLIYLGALVPAPGEPVRDVFRREGVRASDTSGHVEEDAQGRSRWTSFEGAFEIFYRDVEPSRARASFARLRPQAPTPYGEACPLQRFPDVAASYVLMREDRMISPDWSREAAPARLGVEPVEIAGGHSPMLADPVGLAAVLVDLSR